METDKLKAAIFDAEDIKPEAVEVPEWGVTVHLKALDGEARYRISELSASAKARTENSYVVEAYVTEGMVNENGERIIPFEERAMLAKKNPFVVERLCERILELSGIGSNAQADAEAK